MKKNYFLNTIGTLTITAAPIAVVISCGVQYPTKEELFYRDLLKSSKAMDFLQEKYWEKLINTKETTFDPTNPLDIALFKKSFEFILRDKLIIDSKFLTKKIPTIVKTTAFKNLLTNSKKPGTILKKWGFYKRRDAGRDFNVNDISTEAKKFLVKNDKSLKKEFYKQIISEMFLKEAINKKTYKKVFLKKDETLSSLQKLYDDANFSLIKETVDQRLFIQWKLKIDETRTKELSEYIGTKKTTNKNYSDVLTLIKSNGRIYKAQKGSDELKKLYSNLVPLKIETNPDIQSLSSYAGINRMSSKTDGALRFDIDGFKLATNKDDWKGFVTKDELLKKFKVKTTQNKIQFMENGKEIETHFAFGLMPIYKNDKITFIDSYFANAKNKDLLIKLLSKKSSIYHDAIKYYTKRESNKILLDVKLEFFKKAAIKHGFKFIKE